MDNATKKAAFLSWLSLIAVLPISSMPLVARWLGSDSVASPAILFLFFLTVVWLFPAIYKKKYFSGQIFPLSIFCLVALAATSLSFFYDIPAFKGIDQFAATLSALGTLVIGLLFFVTSSSFLETDEQLRMTIRVLNWSGLVMVIWSLMQAFAWYGSRHYPQWMFDFQGLVSARVLYRQRINGFALEPSWLAHQLNMLYLPLWLASTLKRTSVHRFKLWRFSFENLLLLSGIIILLLTLSRVGVAAFILMLAVVLGLLHGRLVNWIAAKTTHVHHDRVKKQTKMRITIFLLILYVSILLFVLVAFARIDPRMQNLFNFSFAQENPMLRLFNELKFGERVIYWLTGWNIFNAYPLAGVGLGNAGFYFPKYLPAYGWSLVEVEYLINRTTLLLNVKSLWMRLLAETGIIGFSVFLGWLVSLCTSILRKIASKEALTASMGLMGILVLTALILEGFSIDSFAMPYWWISLGLAVSRVNGSKDTISKAP